MTLETFLDHLEKPRRSGGGFIAPCPAHPDRSPSLSVSEGDDGRILLRDFAGCTALEITESLGLKLSDLFPGKQTRESRERSRRVKDIKVKKAGIQSIDSYLQGIYREAESTLVAAKGLDVSRWNESELSSAMAAVCDAYETLRSEHDGCRIQEYFSS